MGCVQGEKGARVLLEKGESLLMKTCFNYSDILYTYCLFFSKLITEQQSLLLNIAHDNRLLLLLLLLSPRKTRCDSDMLALQVLFVAIGCCS